VVGAARALSSAGYEVGAIRTVKSKEEPGTAVGTEASVGTAPGRASLVVLRMSGGTSGNETGP
jgi:beta-lactam-binding protein with PASTA domain